MRFPKWKFWLGCGLSVALTVAALVLLATLARDSGARILVTTLGENSTAIGTDIRLKMERAFAAGISLDDLVGVSEVFESELAEHRAISFFALVNNHAKILAFTARSASTELELTQMKQLVQLKENFAHGVRQDESAIQVTSNLGQSFQAVRIPIADKPGNDPTATLFIGYPRNYIDQHINSLAADVIFATLTAVVFVLEFLWFGSQLTAVRDVGRFRAHLKRLALPSFEFRARMTTQDSMGELSRNLDLRLDQIAQRFHSLRHMISQSSNRLTNSTLAIQADLTSLGQRFGLIAEPKDLPSPVDIAHFRIAVFLIAMSSEVCRPFFAVYAAELVSPDNLSSQLLSGIPLTVFLIFWGISQPLGVAVLQRLGARRWLTIAASTVGLGILGSAATDNWYILVGLQALTGFCFGSTLICSLALMIRSGSGGMTSYLTALVAAGICGPVIGGLLASNFGYTTAFMVAATCGFLAIGFMSSPANQAAKKHHRATSLRATLKNMLRGDLLSLLAFSTIPARMVTTALLLIVVPLTISQMDESAAVTGRLILLYFFGLFLLAASAEKLANHWRASKAFVIVGALVMILACLAAYALNGIWGLVTACVLLGVGQSLMAGSQGNLAIQMMARAAPAEANSDLSLGMYRLFDRLGAALGPVFAAVLIERFGLKDVMLWLAVILGVCTLLSLLTFIVFKERRQPHGTLA